MASFQNRAVVQNDLSSAPLLQENNVTPGVVLELEQLKLEREGFVGQVRLAAESSPVDGFRSNAGWTLT